MERVRCGKEESQSEWAGWELGSPKESEEVGHASGRGTMN